MSRREWKPGDVAIVAGERAMRMPFDVATCPTNHDRADHWHGSDGYWITDTSVAHKNARPLLVIDPEDRSAVAGLCDALTGRRAMALPHRLDVFSHLAANADAMQAALREVADPTPPCPASLVTGLAGAIYRCTKPTGHLEPHRSDGYSWTAGVQQVNQ